jgi:hypothetical protein
VYNHRLWDNPAFLKSAFHGGFHASAAPGQARRAPRYDCPRAAFAATSPYAAFIPANRPAQASRSVVSPASLMAAFAARRNLASMQAVAAQNAAQNAARPAPRAPSRPMAVAANPRPHGYTDPPTTPATREIRRCHAPLVPRGID